MQLSGKQIYSAAGPSGPAVSASKVAQRPYVVMSGATTDRAHYFPAFWTALWNRDYYLDPTGKKARDQRVFVLHIRSGKIHGCRLENVFYEKGLGLADISEESMRRCGPLVFGNDRIVQQAIAEVRSAGPLVLDVESVNNVIEQSHCYQEAMLFARSGKLLRPVQKGHIACFLAHLCFRHPRTVGYVVRNAMAVGLDRWAALASMKHRWSDPAWLAEMTAHLALSKWVVHEADDHLFPLGDMAVLPNDTHTRVWCAVSPRHLIEICIGEVSGRLSVSTKVDPSRDKSLLRHYRRLCIEASDRQIIFHDCRVLEEWLDTPEYRMKMRDTSGAMATQAANPPSSR